MLRYMINVTGSPPSHIMWTVKPRGLNQNRTGKLQQYRLSWMPDLVGFEEHKKEADELPRIASMKHTIPDYIGDETKIVWMRMWNARNEAEAIQELQNYGVQNFTHSKAQTKLLTVWIVSKVLSVRCHWL